MREKLRILWNMRWCLRSLLKTIYFNFHYLKFKDAIKLPILLYKPRFVALKGRIKFECPIKFGTIILGTFSSNMAPNIGISFENNGGDIIFKGTCKIGNASSISVGPNATLVIGHNFVNASGARILAFKSVEIGNYVRFGWGVTLMDINFHPLIEQSTGKIKRASGKIIIGDYNWFGMECLIMHSVQTPDRCVFGARTVVTRNTEMEEFGVTVSTMRGKVVTQGVYRDICGENDMDKTL